MEARRANRPPPDAQILRRREQENRAAALQSGLKQVERFTDVAVWERKSAAKSDAQRVRSLVSKSKAALGEALDGRRRALAALLQSERKQFEREFHSSLETADQRLQRMAERAKELKDARERKRLEQVERAYRQRELSAQDEMRLQQSQLRTLKVAKDRAAQLEEKRERAERVRAEDDEYAREWLGSIEEKRAREERERLEALARNAEMKRVLDSQVRDVNERKALQEAELEAQRQKWRDEWRAEAEQARARVAANEEAQRLARVAVQHENLRRAERRGEAAAAEHEMDRILLARQLAKDREEEERRKGEQAALRKANLEFQEHIRRQAVKEAQEQGDLERIRFEESEKEWIKREKKWAREAAEREALMTEVDRVRQMQIADREKARETQRAHDQHYVANKKIEDERAAQAAKAVVRAEADKRLANRQLLEQQIADKQRMQVIERQRELLIDKRAERYTEEFQAKIAQMRTEALEANLEIDNFPRKTMGWN